MNYITFSLRRGNPGGMIKRKRAISLNFNYRIRVLCFRNSSRLLHRSSYIQVSLTKIALRAICHNEQTFHTVCWHLRVYKYFHFTELMLAIFCTKETRCCINIVLYGTWNETFYSLRVLR